MKAGDAIFLVGMILIAFFYMKLTDIQIERLDKRVTDLAWRVHIMEENLKDKSK